MKKFLEKLGLTQSGNTTRSHQDLSDPALIKLDYLQSESTLPLAIQPAESELNVVDWAVSNRKFIEKNLLESGGVLLRNFQVDGVADFEKMMQSAFGKLLEYSYASSPRTKVKNQVYTSTEYPPEESIPLHNEMSYSLNWPMKIAFYSVEAATEGGATPIANSRAIFKRIDPKNRERFEQKKVMYVRNYGNGLDIPWQKVFQTDNKSKLKKYCDKAGIKLEWRDENQLKTYQICQAVAAHPKTKDMVWFNQAHLFHISNLKAKVREQLLSLFEPDELPRNAYYGDGSEIESSILDEIREIYKQEAVRFPWQPGDIMLLDNMLSAHGRDPFVGSRKVLVGMTN